MVSKLPEDSMFHEIRILKTEKERQRATIFARFKVTNIPDKEVSNRVLSRMIEKLGDLKQLPALAGNVELELKYNSKKKFYTLLDSEGNTVINYEPQNKDEELHLEDDDISQTDISNAKEKMPVYYIMYFFSLLSDAFKSFIVRNITPADKPKDQAAVLAHPVSLEIPQEILQSGLDNDGKEFRLAMASNYLLLTDVPLEQLTETKKSDLVDFENINNRILEALNNGTTNKLAEEISQKNHIFFLSGYFSGKQFIPIFIEKKGGILRIIDSSRSSEYGVIEVKGYAAPLIKYILQMPLLKESQPLKVLIESIDCSGSSYYVDKNLQVDYARKKYGERASVTNLIETRLTSALGMPLQTPLLRAVVNDIAKTPKGEICIFKSGFFKSGELIEVQVEVKRHHNFFYLQLNAGNNEVMSCTFPTDQAKDSTYPILESVIAKILTPLCLLTPEAEVTSSKVSFDEMIRQIVELPYVVSTIPQHSFLKTANRVKEVRGLMSFGRLSAPVSEGEKLDRGMEKILENTTEYIKKQIPLQDKLEQVEWTIREWQSYLRKNAKLLENPNSAKMHQVPENIADKVIFLEKARFALRNQLQKENQAAFNETARRVEVSLLPETKIQMEQPTPVLQKAEPYISSDSSIRQKEVMQCCTAIEQISNLSESFDIITTAIPLIKKAHEEMLNIDDLDERAICCLLLNRAINQVIMCVPIDSVTKACSDLEISKIIRDGLILIQEVHFDTSLRINPKQLPNLSRLCFAKSILLLSETERRCIELSTPAERQLYEIIDVPPLDRCLFDFLLNQNHRSTFHMNPDESKLQQEIASRLNPVNYLSGRMEKLRFFSELGLLINLLENTLANFARQTGECPIAYELNTAGYNGSTRAQVMMSYYIDTTDSVHPHVDLLEIDKDPSLYVSASPLIVKKHIRQQRSQESESGILKKIAYSNLLEQRGMITLAPLNKFNLHISSTFIKKDDNYKPVLTQVDESTNWKAKVKPHSVEEIKDHRFALASLVCDGMPIADLSVGNYPCLELDPREMEENPSSVTNGYPRLRTGANPVTELSSASNPSSLSSTLCSMRMYPNIPLEVERDLHRILLLGGEEITNETSMRDTSLGEEIHPISILYALEFIQKHPGVCENMNVQSALCQKIFGTKAFTAVLKNEAYCRLCMEQLQDLRRMHENDPDSAAYQLSVLLEQQFNKNLPKELQKDLPLPSSLSPILYLYFLSETNTDPKTNSTAALFNLWVKSKSDHIQIEAVIRQIDSWMIEKVVGPLDAKKIENLVKEIANERSIPYKRLERQSYFVFIDKESGGIINLAEGINSLPRVEGAKEETGGRRPQFNVPIREPRILSNPQFRKLFGDRRINGGLEILKDNTCYYFTLDGIDYEIYLSHNPQVPLKIKANFIVGKGGQEKKTFVYQLPSQTTQPNTALQLASNCGIWTYESNSNEKYIFLNKRPEVNSENTFRIDDHLKVYSMSGNKALLDAPEVKHLPWKMVHPQECFFLGSGNTLDTIALKNANIQLSKKKDNWHVMQKGMDLGAISQLRIEDMHLFGRSTDEYVLPLENDVDGNRQWLVFPLKSDIVSRNVFDFHNETIGEPMFIKMDKSGKIHGPKEALFYLAHLNLQMAIHSSKTESIQHLNIVRMLIDQSQEKNFNTDMAAVLLNIIGEYTKEIGSGSFKDRLKDAANEFKQALKEALIIDPVPLKAGHSLLEGSLDQVEQETKRCENLPKSEIIAIREMDSKIGLPVAEIDIPEIVPKKVYNTPIQQQLSILQAKPADKGGYLKQELAEGIEDFAQSFEEKAFTEEGYHLLKQGLKNDIETSKSEVKKLKGMLAIQFTYLPDYPAALARFGQNKEAAFEYFLSKWRDGAFANDPGTDSCVARYSLLSIRLKMLQKMDQVVEENAALLEAKPGTLSFQEKASHQAVQNTLSQLLSASIDPVPNTAGLGSLEGNKRRLIYVQYRHGIVYRPEQLKLINEFVEKPQIMRVMRMGLGKTSTIIPAVMDILSKKGFAVGVVPEELFQSQFLEADETARVLFDMAGYAFRFNLSQLTPDDHEGNLIHLNRQYQRMLHAKAHHGFVLTTPSTKPALDDAIVRCRLLLDEWLHAEKARIETHNMIHPGEEIPTIDLGKGTPAMLLKSIDVLGRMIEMLNSKETQIIVDEGDHSLSSHKQVNAEIEAGNALTTAEQYDIKNLFIYHLLGNYQVKTAIINNDQALIDEKTIKNVLRAFIDSVPISEDDKEMVLDPNANFDGIPDASDRQRLKTLHLLYHGGLASLLSRKATIGLKRDEVSGIVAVPATQTISEKNTHFGETSIQLAATYLMTLSSPDWPDMAFVNKFWDELVNVIPSLKNASLKDRLGLLKNLNQEQSLKARLLLAEKAGSEAIFGSRAQIIRNVQASWLGCNLSLISGSEGHHTDLLIPQENIPDRRARKVTAEVRVRMAVALGEKGLDTKLRTLQTGSFPDGIDVIINQGGFQENKDPRQLIADMAEHYSRNVVFIDPITRDKMILIRNEMGGQDATIPFQSANKKDLEKAFYYYDPAATRGTNFVLPQKAKAAVFLSPTATISQHEQTVYRLRDIGSGHAIELYASEAIKEKLESEYNQEPTAGDFLDYIDRNTEKGERTLNTLGVIQMQAAEKQNEILKNLVEEARNLLESPPVSLDDIETKIHANLNMVQQEFVKVASREAPARQKDKEQTSLQLRAQQMQKSFGLEDSTGAIGAVEQESQVSTSKQTETQSELKQEVSAESSVARAFKSAIKKQEFNLNSQVLEFIKKGRNLEQAVKIPLEEMQVSSMKLRVDVKTKVDSQLTFTPKEMPQMAIIAEQVISKKKAFEDKTDRFQYRIMPMADAILWGQQRKAANFISKEYQSSCRIFGSVGGKLVEAANIGQQFDSALNGAKIVYEHFSKDKRT